MLPLPIPKSPSMFTSATQTSPEPENRTGVKREKPDMDKAENAKETLKKPAPPSEKPPLAKLKVSKAGAVGKIYSSTITASPSSTRPKFRVPSPPKYQRPTEVTNKDEFASGVTSPVSQSPPTPSFHLPPPPPLESPSSPLPNNKGFTFTNGHGKHSHNHKITLADSPENNRHEHFTNGFSQQSGANLTASATISQNTAPYNTPLRSPPMNAEPRSRNGNNVEPLKMSNGSNNRHFPISSPKTGPETEVKAFKFKSGTLGRKPPNSAPTNGFHSETEVRTFDYEHGRLKEPPKVPAKTPLIHYRKPVKIETNDESPVDLITESKDDICAMDFFPPPPP